MSRDTWPTKSSPTMLPQPIRITNFTRLGTELSLGDAPHLPPLCLSLLGQQRGAQGKPRAQILRITTSWTIALESFQQSRQNRKQILALAQQYQWWSFWLPHFKTTMRSISFLCRANIGFRLWG